MDRTILRGVLLALAAALLLASAGPAGATVTPVVGGPGGGVFQLKCSNDRFLVGLYARAGSWVDGVGLVCAPYDANTRRFGAFASFVREGWTGGPGGAPQEIYCNQGEAVTGLGFSHTRGGGLPRQYVMELGLFCQHRSPAYPDRCITSGHGCKAPASVVSYDYGIVRTAREYQYDKLFCPSGEYATGIHGRSGLYLDAIGLICAPLPEPPKKVVIRKLGRSDKQQSAAVTPKPIKRIGKAKAATQAPAPAQTKTATAIDDVDIYAGPGGHFENTGLFMRQGESAPVLGHHPDGWYRLQLTCGRPECWVAEDHLEVSP